MDRRKFLSLSTVAFISISTPISLEASIWNKIKEFMKTKYKITFAKFYPKPLWEKSYFSWIIMGVTVVAAGAVSYFTAGAGAPEAAAGVSTVASWIGGGGAGSYMAGLSTVGSAVGGNAMVGAAILNGISLGTIGWGTTETSLTLAAKVATLIDASMNGFIFIKNSNSNSGIYVFDIKIPKDMGSDEVQDLTDGIYKIYDKKQDALKDKEYDKAKILDENLKNYYLLGKKMLQKELVKEKPNIYNLIVLGIITYKIGDIDLYYQALNTIDLLYNEDIKKRSFLDYLWGIYYLSIPDNQKNAQDYFENSYYEENYVIEPVLIIIDLLAQNYFENKIIIINWVKNAADNYDGDKYDGKGLLSLYYKAATTSFLNNDWKQAIEYYEKAYDELGILGKLIWTTKPIKKQIKLYIAICYKHLENDEKANEYLNDALDYCKNDKEKEEIKKVYNES